MKATLKELSNELGVGYVLSAYETCPWSASDDTGNKSCCAEVRMNGNEEELEAEIQLVQEAPPAGQKPLERILYMLAKPSTTDIWEIRNVAIKGENKSEEIYDWEGKSVRFFSAVVQELKMNKFPDIEALYEREINKKESYSGNSQGGGGKSPKIKPQQLLNPKGGRM